LTATLGVHQRSIWETWTLRELYVRHDAYQIERWWHTAFIVCSVYNLQTIVANALSSKSRMRPKTPSEFHPFVDSSNAPGKMKITKKNISFLKGLAGALQSY